MTAKLRAPLFHAAPALLLAALFPLFVGCGKAKKAGEDSVQHALPDSAAVYYYRLPWEGDFAGYVAAMHSCDNATPEYRQRMETYLRDYQSSLAQEKGGGPASVSVAGRQLSADGTYARVFLSVAYKDGTAEEVQFPMVFAGGKWRIQ